MKSLLYASLLLNLALLSFGLWRQRPVSPFSRALRLAARSPGAGWTSLQSGNRSAAQPATPWKAVESPDPAQFMANLRAIGCPEATLRDIIVLGLCREHRNRTMATMADAAQRRPYWQEQGRTREANDAFLLQAELNNELQTTLESLFGQPYSAITESILGWSRADFTDFLPLEKRRQFRDLELRYRRLFQDAAAQSAEPQFYGSSNPADRARIDELTRQKEAELAGILSPQELEEYQLRRSPAADYARSQLPLAKSEAEYRTMVKLVQECGLSAVASSMAQRYGLPDPAAEQAKPNQKPREFALEQRLKEVFGEQRYAEMQQEEKARQTREMTRSQESEAQLEQEKLSAIADLSASTTSAASQFLERLKTYESGLPKRLQELDRSLPGSPEEKRQQITAIIQGDYEHIGLETLGPQGRDVLKQLRPGKVRGD